MKLFLPRKYRTRPTLPPYIITKLLLTEFSFYVCRHGSVCRNCVIREQFRLLSLLFRFFSFAPILNRRGPPCRKKCIFEEPMWANDPKTCQIMHLRVGGQKLWSLHFLEDTFANHPNIWVSFSKIKHFFNPIECLFMPTGSPFLW